MASPLPLPKHRLWRIVAVDLYLLTVFSVSGLLLKYLQHKQWSWYREELLTCALIVAFTSWATNIDYVGWRDKRQPITTINLDHDEAQSLRVKRSTPEPPEVI